MPGFSTLLVANRGEIAVRIMRTAKALGLRCVAVCSEADADAPHVRMADEAVLLGPAPVADSYLRGDRIIEAARATGAEAIHPGFGFLSENAAFARAVTEAGLIFVGPPAAAIDLMGDKARAKRRMIESGVPCVPGYEGADQSEARFIETAAEIGFPVMVKAAAGGGGRGMRLVQAPEDLGDAVALARSEAENAFGSGDLILEKAVVRARHVEIQIFADAHGSVIHLGERDCSVQRRHQKVIEEAPCPVMTPALRDAMGRAAVEAARAVDYRGAGTVEFLLDASGDFYFLEMNTRLQVEHPVTEVITGLDLVALQLQVARGEPLGIAQEDVRLTGHAIEVRLYAEDPASDFLPSTGPVALWHPPSGDGIRVDAGVETGGEISPYYDPMVAKIIAHGATRDEARRRLRSALSRTALFGPRTNRDFLIHALEQESFAAGEATTAFIGDVYGPAGFSLGPPTPAEMAAAAVIQHAAARRRGQAECLGVSADLLDWSSTDNLESVVEYAVGETAETIRVHPRGRDRFEVDAGGQCHTVVLKAFDAQMVLLTVDGRSVKAIHRDTDGSALDLATGTRSHVYTNVAAVLGSAADAAGGGTVTAPMHGRLLDLFVAEGDRVAKGDRLAVLEAMKMQHEILAEIDGVVATVAGTVGTQMAARDLILEIEPAEGG